MDQINEIENTFIEEYCSAKLLINNSMKKSALILLAKALFALTDYLILKKYGKLPKNHSERFRILEEKEKEIYKNIDEVWDKYTDSYSKPSSEESINMLKNAIKEVVM